ncbi:MAG: GPW/gp25 family protein [Sphingomonadales bacterium]
MMIRNHLLKSPTFLSFPFRMTDRGGAQSTKSSHIREQIEQVIFTSPGERIFRPEFGLGARQLIFEPNNDALWKLAQNRFYASLADALQGEVDPKTLQVEVKASPDAPEKLLISVSYTLAAIKKEERHEMTVGAD